MYNKLRQAQDPGKSRDPLEFLPLELAQIVIQQLNLRDQVYVHPLDNNVFLVALCLQHIRVCLAVTKGWKRLLESSYDLWTTFDTNHTRRPISKLLLENCDFDSLNMKLNFINRIFNILLTRDH